MADGSFCCAQSLSISRRRITPSYKTVATWTPETFATLATAPKRPEIAQVGAANGTDGDLARVRADGARSPHFLALLTNYSRRPSARTNKK
jgi:hypothetical protein|eukprot:4024649-Prymnesium_polylepis.1